MPLTDIKIKSLKPKEKPYKVFDGGGLYIYVSCAGSKTFRIKYTFNKKENIYTVGEYPQVSLRDARFRLLEIKELISQGIDPAVEKKKNIPQAEANMFREVALEWTEKQKNKWSEGHRQTIVYRLERYINPHLGAFRIFEITAPQVFFILRKLEEQGKNDITRRLLSIMSQVFRYGVACGLCDSDPCRDLLGSWPIIKARRVLPLPIRKKWGSLCAIL